MVVSGGLSEKEEREREGLRERRSEVLSEY